MKTALHGFSRGKQLLRDLMPNLLRRISRSLSSERKRRFNGSNSGNASPSSQEGGGGSFGRSKSKDSSFLSSTQNGHKNTPSKKKKKSKSDQNPNKPCESTSTPTVMAWMSNSETIEVKSIATTHKRVNLQNPKCHFCGTPVPEHIPTESEASVIAKPLITCKSCEDELNNGLQRMASADETICAGCAKEVDRVEVSVTAGEETWHRLCFRCTLCLQVISQEFFFREGRQHCVECYKTHCNVTCLACSQLVVGPMITAGSKRYHPHCAFCSVCGGRFTKGEDMLTEGDEIWHGRCTELRKSIRQVESLIRGAEGDQPGGDSPGRPLSHHGTHNYQPPNTSQTITLPVNRLRTIPNVNSRMRKSITFLGKDYTTSTDIPLEESYEDPARAKASGVLQPTIHLAHANRLRYTRKQMSRRRLNNRLISHEPTIVEAEFECDSDQTCGTISNRPASSYIPSEYPHSPSCDFAEIKTHSTGTFSYSELKTSNPSLPTGVERRHLEKHLDDADFLAVFKCPRSDFYEMPRWKQDALKKLHSLF